MIGDAVVIDAVVHGYNSPPERFTHPVAGLVLESLYTGYHRALSPRGEPRWLLDRERFERADPDLLAHALFAESQVDFAIYHDIPLYGLYEGGASPLWIGREMRERHPDRVALFGGIWPHAPDALAEVDRLVDEAGCVGLKFYPYDIYDGTGETTLLNDREAVFPILEHARSRGIRHIAVHKAIGMVGCPVAPFGVADLEDAFVAFPDLSFQIIHGGFAFLEETALQLTYFPNVSVVLEGASAFLPNSPRRFGEILARFLMTGAASRIVWGTGCTAIHPRPLVEAFWDYELPEDLVEGYGLPPLSPRLKAAILGGNIARIMGLEVPGFARGELAEPWTPAVAA